MTRPCERKCLPFRQMKNALIQGPANNRSLPKLPPTGRLQRPSESRRGSNVQRSDGRCWRGSGPDKRTHNEKVKVKSVKRFAAVR